MRDLTLRGRCFAAAGLVTAVAGSAVGESDLVRLGLLALLVPVLSWVAVRHERRGARRLRAELRVVPERVEVGATGRVLLECSTRARRSPAFAVDLDLPPAVGHVGRAVRLQVPALTRERPAVVEHPVRPTSRGRHVVGPVHARATDPLGMAVTRTELDVHAAVLVTPRTEALPRVLPGGRRATAGARHAREVLGGGTPDVVVREYAQGDDLRRVHWPTSARVQELMVRREESEERPRCTVLLDDRLTAQRGDSFERAVEVAASVLRLLAELGVETRLVLASGAGAGGSGGRPGRRAGSGARVGPGSGLGPVLGAGLGAGLGSGLGSGLGTGTGHLAGQLEQLALVQESRSALMGGVAGLSGSGASGASPGSLGGLGGLGGPGGAGGAVVAVLGRLDEGDRAVLAPLAAAGRAAYALVLDVDSWHAHAGTEHPVPAAVPALRGSGWRTATLPRHGSLADAWAELSR